MEKHLGRFLEPKEVIHHINGNPSDDEISNLSLTNSSEHMRSHRSGNPWPPALKNCWWKNRKYHTRAKLDAASVALIRKLYSPTKRNGAVLAKQFGVAHNTIMGAVNKLTWKGHLAADKFVRATKEITSSVTAKRLPTAIEA